MGAKCFLTTLLSSLVLLVISLQAASQNHQHATNALGGSPDQYVETVSELSSRARANVYFKNPQSIFRGVQFGFVNVGAGNITFLRRDLITSGRIPIVLARIYDSASQGSPDFGPGWLVSATETISFENGKARLSAENGSIIDFVQGPNAGKFQLEKDYPSDYITLEQTDSVTIAARLRTGLIKEFKQIGALFRLTKVTDRNGNVLRLTYEHELLSKIENGNHFIQFTRNSKGRVIIAQDDSQRAARYFYDDSGRLMRVDDIAGKAWTYTYTAIGQLKNATDPLQRSNFEISYDDSGHVRRLQLPSGSIKYRYDAEHGLTTVIDRKQLISRFFQNTEGITMRVINALGEETAIALDGARNVISLSRNGLNVEQMDYDHQHRLLSRHTTDTAGVVERTYSYDPVTGLLSGVLSSDGRNRAFAYDSVGNLTSATLADGEHRYRYSPSGDLISLATGSTSVTFSPNSDGLTASMTENGQVTSLQYKPGGELSAATFPKAPPITYEYQPSGLRAKILFGNKRRAEYSYDAAGNLTASKIFDAHGKQINGQELEMNDSYQLIKWTLFDGTITSFQYDPNGNLTEIRKADSRMRFEYDSLNRLTAVITPDGQRFVYNYKPGERSVVDQHQHSSVLVEDLRDTGFTFSGAFQVTAIRPVAGVFGTVRFSEELGTYELSNADGSDIARPQANIESALGKQFLVNTNVTTKARQSGFNIPFNTMFMPAEYASINCCPECYNDGDGWYCPPCFVPPPSPIPSLTSIDPSSAATNAGSVNVTLSGAFNDSSERINIGGSGITADPNPAPVDANGNAATTFKLASTVMPGSYGVSVFDSGGYSNSVAFNVTPVITSISPARGLIGIGITVTINGAGFATGATVSAGSNISVSNISISSSTQMTATFTPTNSSSAGGNQNVTVNVNGQTSNAQNFFVQVPTNLSVLSVTVLPDGPDPPAGCAGSTPYGIKIDATYVVLDQSGNAIQSSNMTPHETGTFFTGGNFDNDIGPVPGYPTSSKTTAADGTFHDVPVGICRNLPISDPGLTAHQIITMVLPSGSSYQVRDQTITVKAPGAASFEHGTMTNSLNDLNATR